MFLTSTAKWQTEAAIGWTHFSSRELEMSDRPKPGDRIAYFGRVSTPKQKLEHHWEQVENWLTRNGLNVEPNRRFEDKIRRHEKRYVN